MQLIYISTTRTTHLPFAFLNTIYYITQLVTPNNSNHMKRPKTKTIVLSILLILVALFAYDVIVNDVNIATEFKRGMDDGNKNIRR